MMRKLFTVAAVLIGISINAQWDTLNTSRSNLTYRAICFHNGTDGVAIGYDAQQAYGYAIYTTDRGNSWSDYFAFTSDRFDVDFTPGGTVWVVGDSGRYVHKNFPLTSHISDGNLTSYALHTGYAVNDSVFFCAGEHGVAFRTSDRGLAWDTLNTLTTETIYDLYFANAANGWLVGDGGVVKVTADSGTTWTQVNVPTFGFVDFRSFAYQDSLGMNPYLVGEGGYGGFSIDGGASWNAMALGTTETLNRIRFGTFNAGIIVGNGGMIRRTDTGGWNWFSDSSVVSVDLFDIAYAADTTAFICGDSGVILRSNINISSVQPHEANYFTSQAYPNPCNGPLNLQLRLTEQSNITIDVISMTGALIQSEYHENVSPGEQAFQLDLSSQPAGVYLVRMSNEYSTVNLRVIRQ